MTDPLGVDLVLQRRINTRVASQYLGVSIRQVQVFIETGLLDAVDMRSRGAKRPAWSVTVGSVRRLLLALEFKKNNAGSA